MADLDLSQSLYFQDPYCREFDATILECDLIESGGWEIILDRTFFYPTGGGQDHDNGFISTSRITDITRDEETGVVRHIVEEKLSTGLVTCKIDWDIRQRAMQHHSGQHLLSQCLLQLFGYQTLSANINAKSPSTLDISADRLLTDEEIEEADALANQIIQQNRIIKAYFVDQKNITQIPLRRQPKVNENIRIVEIEGFDYSACGGTHCTMTGEISLINILRTDRINNKTRIVFVAGQQAFELFVTYHQMIREISSTLNTSMMNIVDSVKKLYETSRMWEKESQKYKNNALTLEAQALLSSAEKISDHQLVFHYFENRQNSDLRVIIDVLKLVDNQIAVFLNFETNRLTIIVTCGRSIQFKANEILDIALSIINGKGGGDSSIAQGGGLVEENNIYEIQNSVYLMIRELIY